MDNAAELFSTSIPAGFNEMNPSLGYASTSSKYFGDPMSDRVSLSSPLFPELNALEQMTVQEVDSASLGYAFMTSEFIDPINDGLPFQQSTFPGLEWMRVHDVDANSGYTTRSRSKEMISVMGWGQCCRHAPGSTRHGSLLVARNACPGGPPVCLPIFF